MAAAVTSSMATSVAAALMWQVLAVEAFLQLFLGSLPDLEHLSAEIQGLAGHGMVEVHNHDLLLDFHHLSVHDFAGTVEHGDEPALDQYLVVQFPVHHECDLGYLHHVRRVIFTVAFLR